jgi:hypothetical protein
MSKIDELLSKYQRIISEPWPTGLSGQEKVWFLIFDPIELRKMEFKLGEFEIATKNANKDWHLISLQTMFSDWLSKHDYRDSFFEDPEYLSDALQDDFNVYIKETIINALNSKNSENTLVVLKDVSAIFGFIKLSEVINAISNKIQGRLMVLFPGEFINNQYRLMDARDGWDYLARPIML